MLRSALGIEHPAALDDAGDAPGVPDVGERVGLQDDEVGEPAGSTVPRSSWPMTAAPRSPPADAIHEPDRLGIVGA